MRVRGQQLRVAFGRTAFHPIGDARNLFLREARVVLELAEAFYRVPGRHAAIQNFFLDCDRPRTSFLEFYERDGRRATLVVTTGAASKEDAGDLTRPRQPGCYDVMCIRDRSEEREE